MNVGRASPSASLPPQPQLQRARSRLTPTPGRLSSPVRYVVVVGLVALHVAGFLVLDMVLSLNRLAAMDQGVVQVAFIAAQSAQSLPRVRQPSSHSSPAPRAAAVQPAGQPPSPASEADDAAQALSSLGDPPALAIVSNPAEEGVSSGAEGQQREQEMAAQGSEVEGQAARRTDSSGPSPLPLAFDAPASLRLHYVLRKGNDSARSELVWRVEGEGDQRRYTLRLEAFKWGVSGLRQHSEGVLHVGGLAPQRYSDKRFGQSARATHFQRAPDGSAQIVFSSNKPGVMLKDAHTVQDRISVMLQLAGWFRAEAQLGRQVGRNFELPVASAEDVQIWRFELLGQEQLHPTEEGHGCQGEGGTVMAAHLRRTPRKAYDQMVEVWLGQACGFVPIRIRLTDSSGQTEMQLKSMESL